MNQNNKKEVFRIFNKIDLNESRLPKMYPLEILADPPSNKKENSLSKKQSIKASTKTKKIRSSVFIKQQNITEINKYLFSQVNLKNAKTKNKSQTSRKNGRYFAEKSSNLQKLKTQQSHFSNNKDKRRLSALLQTSDNLQKLMAQIKINKQRCLMGQNIMKMQRKFSYTRFQLHELYSIYRTLLQFCKGSGSSFLRGMMTILNSNKIIIREQILEQQFRKIQWKLTFQSFAEVFSKIQNLVFKQTLTDFIQLMFDSYNPSKISYNQVEQAFKKRCSAAIAKQRTTYIFEALKLSIYQFTNLNQLLNLCIEDQQFSQEIYGMYLKQFQFEEQNS